MKPEEYDAVTTAISARSSATTTSPKPSASARTFEFERSLAAFDDGQPVATLGTYTLGLSVPGGELASAGTTWVSVAQTHRRRGLLRRLMTGAPRGRRRARRAAGRAVGLRGAAVPPLRVRDGLPAAALRARAAPRARVRRARSHGRGPHPRAAGRRAPPRCSRPIYDAVRAQRPGMASRTPTWWDVADAARPDRPRRVRAQARRGVRAARTQGRPPTRCTAPRRSGSRAGMPSGEIDVTELMGADPASEAAVWRYLLDTDLVGSLRRAAPAARRPAAARGRRPAPRPAHRGLRRAVGARRRRARRARRPQRGARRRTSCCACTTPCCQPTTARGDLHVDAEGAATCERSSAAPDLELPTEARRRALPRRHGRDRAAGGRPGRRAPGRGASATSTAPRDWAPGPGRPRCSERRAARRSPPRSRRGRPGRWRRRRRRRSAVSIVVARGRR